MALRQHFEIDFDGETLFTARGANPLLFFLGYDTMRPKKAISSSEDNEHEE